MLGLLTALAATTSAVDELTPPALDRLPAGAIQPEGWLKAQALLQGNGMTGALGFWGDGISVSMWMAGSNGKTAGLQGSGYYLNGMIPLSCQIDLPHLRRLRDASVEHILNITREKNRVDGFLGPDIGNGSAHFQKDPNDYWGRMSVVLGLEAFCECTGPFAPPAALQQEAEAALLSHHIAFAKHVAAHSPEFTHDVWGSARYSEALLGTQWLVDRGHTDPALFQLMRDVRGQSEAVLGWEQWFRSGDPKATMTRFTTRCWGNTSDPTESNWQKHHGVTIMEAIKTGAAWYRVSGNASDANNSAAAVAWIDKWSRSTDGTFSAPDCITEVPHTPTAGVETCSVVEEMFSLRTAYEVTGDIKLFDRLEWVAFNSMPSTTDARWTGNSHYHSVNQVDARSGTKSFSPFNGCCTGNVHQGWPKFIMSGIQTAHGAAATSIVISGYSPQTATLADGTSIAISGQYPFADNATVAIKFGSTAAAAAAAAAELSAPGAAVALRIPCWVEAAEIIIGADPSTAGAPLQATPCRLFHVPVAAVASAEAAGVLSLSVQFRNKIVVTSNNELGAQKWYQPSNAVEITRGPLLFTFPIPSVSNITQLNGTTNPVWAKKFAGMPSAMVQVTSVSIDGTQPWQIALQAPASDGSLVFSGFRPLSAVPFDHTTPPAVIKVHAKVVHDPNPRGYPKGNVPGSPVPAAMTKGSPLIDVELVPIAHSNGLRLTVLPVLGGG